MAGIASNSGLPIMGVRYPRVSLIVLDLRLEVVLAMLDKGLEDTVENRLDDNEVARSLLTDD